MAIQVTCPTCQSKYQLGDAVQGKNIRCKKCGEIFRIASASAPAAPAVIHPVMPSADIRSGIQPPPIGPHSPLVYAEPVRSEENHVDVPPHRGSSTLKILLVVFGSLAAVGVVTCGGIILLGYRATQAAKEKFEEIQAHVEANDPGAAVDLSTKPPANLDEALEYLRDGSASKRHAGAQWLARASRDAGRQEEVARHLLRLLNDSNSQVRLAGGRALEKWATRQSVPALLDVLKDEDGAAAELRQTAIRTLGRLRDDRAAGPLAQRLTHFFDREHAARALEDMGPMAESAVVKFFHHPDNAARESARRILQSYHTKEDVILSQSIQDLKGPDFDSRKIVAMWLCQTPVNEARRREVAEGLTLLLTDGRPDVRLAGLKALGIWGTSNDVPAMIRAVDDDSNDVRQLAMQTLVQLKDPRGVDAIAGRLTNFFDRDQATRALQDAGPAAEKAVVRYYHHKDREVRERARRLLKEYNTKLSVILEQTVVDLKSPENEMRVSCAEWFASQAPVEEDRKAVADALDKLLTDMDQGVRLAGMKALRKWATKDNVPALVLRAAAVFPSIADTPLMRTELLRALKSSDYATQQAAIDLVLARYITDPTTDELSRQFIAATQGRARAVLIDKLDPNKFALRLSAASSYRAVSGEPLPVDDNLFSSRVVQEAVVESLSDKSPAVREATQDLVREQPKLQAIAKVPPATRPAPDFDYFVQKIQPILNARGSDGKACAMCHATHAIFKLTLNNPRANYESALKVVNTSEPRKSVLLIKPTRPNDAVGDANLYLATHNGGERWQGNEDSPEYETILEWIRGARLQPAAEDRR